MAGQVFWSRAKRHLRVEDDQADFRPFAERVQIDTTTNQSLESKQGHVIKLPRYENLHQAKYLCQVPATGFQRVSSEGDGTSNLAGFQELHQLAQWENFHELFHQKLIVAVVQAQVLCKQGQIFFATPAWLSQPPKISLI